MRRVLPAALILLWISGCISVRMDEPHPVTIQEAVVISAEQKSAGSELLPVRESGRIGYINREGEIVVVPRFEDGDFFSEGLARVKLGGLWGYIAPDGSWAIEPQFLTASDFHQSRAAVTFNERSGTAETPSHSGAGHNLSGYVDPAGNRIMAGYFPQLTDFAEVGDRRIAGVEMVVERKLVPFGLSFLQEISPSVHDRSSLHIVDDQGNEVAEVRNADRINTFSEGLAAFLERGSLTRPVPRWGFISADGQVRIPAQFDAVGAFSEGFAVAAAGGSFGYVDTSGNWTITPNFELAGPFREGLARVRYGGHWGYIDPSGEFVIAPGFEAAGDFSEGLAAVQQDGTFGYVHRDGSYAIPPQFDQAGPFRNGLAHVRSHSHNHYVSADGTIVWSGRAD